MNSVAEPVETLNDWLADTVGEADGNEPAWLTGLRQVARERVAREPAPGRRQEAWRYSNPRALLEQRFSSADLTDAGVTAEQLGRLAVPDLDAWRVVLVNGLFEPSLSQLDGLPDGVLVTSLKQAMADRPDWLAGHLNQVAGQGAHIFAALNTAAMQDGCVIRVAQGVELNRPLELIQLSTRTEQPRLIQPR